MYLTSSVISIFHFLFFSIDPFIICTFVHSPQMLSPSPDSPMTAEPINHSDFSQDIKDLGAASDDLLDLLPETQLTPPSQLTGKKRKQREPLKRLFRTKSVIEKEKRNKERARQEKKVSKDKADLEKKHEKSAKEEKRIKKYRAILGNYFTKPFEIPATDRFLNLGAMVLKTLYPPAQERFAISIYNSFYRKSNDQEREEIWEGAEGGDDPEFAIKMMKAGIKEAQEANPDWKVCYDPVLSDRVLADLVSRYLGKEFIISNTKGDGWQWNDKEKLWQVMEAAHATRMVTDILMTLYRKKLVIFSELKEDKAFQLAIGQYGKCINVVKALSALRPDQKLLTPNHSAWELPCLGYTDREVPRVIDLKQLKSRPRCSTDFFTGCTGRYFIQEDDPRARIGAKIHIRMYRKVCRGITNEDMKIAERDALLEKIYPDVHKFLKTSLPVLEKRDFLSLRLSLGMTTDVRDRSGYFLYGIGSNGKTKLVESLITALGKTFADIVPKSVIIKKAGKEFSNAAQHTAHMIPLVPIRLSLINETDRTDIVDNTSFKNVVEGATVQVRGIFQGFTSAQLRAKVFIASQFPAKIDTTDQAMWDRLLAIKVDVRFWTDNHEIKPAQDGWDEKNGIHWIKRTLESDRFCAKMFLPEPAGFLNQLFSYYCLVAYAAYGMMERTADGLLPVPKIIRDETKEFFSHCDEVKEFLDENTKQAKGWHEGDLASTVYTKFAKWQNESGTARAWKRKNFLEALKFKGLYNRAWRTLKGYHTLLVLVDENTKYIEEQVGVEDLLPVDLDNLKETKTIPPPLPSESIEAPPPGRTRISHDVPDVGGSRLYPRGHQMCETYCNQKREKLVQITIYGEGGSVPTETIRQVIPKPVRKGERMAQMLEVIKVASEKGIKPTALYLNCMGFGCSLVSKWVKDLPSAMKAYISAKNYPIVRKPMTKRKRPAPPGTPSVRDLLEMSKKTRMEPIVVDLPISPLNLNHLFP